MLKSEDQLIKNKKESEISSAMLNRKAISTLSSFNNSLIESSSDKENKESIEMATQTSVYSPIEDDVVMIYNAV